MEIWKDINTHIGLYKISSYGRVKRLEREIFFNLANQYGHYDEKKRIIKEKILSPKIRKGNRPGYKSVYLYKNKNKKFYSIHFLVASAFLFKDKDKTEINHKDCNPSNNYVDNLEWVTRSENIKHAYKNHKLDHVTNKKHMNMMTFYGKIKNRIRIRQRDLNNNVIGIYSSMKKASEKTGIPITQICACVNGRRKTAYNFIWEKYC